MSEDKDPVPFFWDISVQTVTSSEEAISLIKPTVLGVRVQMKLGDKDRNKQVV